MSARIATVHIYATNLRTESTKIGKQESFILRPQILKWLGGNWQASTVWPVAK